ncbi:MAG: hypothetical protein RL341_1955 [Pseudomonadota bacterium]|jgi:hypothetical protein
MQATIETQTQETVQTQAAVQIEAKETARTLTALELCMVGGGRGSVSLE